MQIANINGMFHHFIVKEHKYRQKPNKYVASWVIIRQNNHHPGKEIELFLTLHKSLCAQSRSQHPM